jgi:hypothetical protein
MHERGHNLLLSDEEKARGEEKSEAHPPKMACDACGGGNTTAQNHLEVQRGGERCERSEGIVARRRVSRGFPRLCEQAKLETFPLSALKASRGATTT